MGESTSVPVRFLPSFFLFSFSNFSSPRRRTPVGSGYASTTGYGFFRITFSIQPRQFVLALERIEKFAGLGAVVEGMKREYLEKA
jgi:hypothetical protein